MTMRVTSKMMQNTYLRNTNALTRGTQNSLNQLSSGMKIFRASEDTAAAVKAYQVRTSLLRNVGYKSNLSHADAVLTSSESVLMGIESTLKEAKGKIVQSLNTPTGEDGRKIIAGELKSIQDQIFQALNTNDSGFYIFGGSNTDQKPFTLGANGELLYNGHTLSELPNNQEDATVRALSDDSLYLDIGLAPEFLVNGRVDKNTVFEYSVTGIDVVGYGMSGLTNPKDGSVVYSSVVKTSGNATAAASFGKEFTYDGSKWVNANDSSETYADSEALKAALGFDAISGTPVEGTKIAVAADGAITVENVQAQAPNNLYDVIGALVAEFSKPEGEYDPQLADALYSRFETAVDTVTTQLTAIGAKTSYIEYSESRISTQNINLKQKQSSIEDVDYAEGYTTYTSLYTSYQAALQIGSKIIGPSLFDYL